MKKFKKIMIIAGVVIFVLLVVLLGIAVLNGANSSHGYAGKPVIYLYPEKETSVNVKLEYEGEFTYTYPEYNKGWNVTAFPDGKIINKADSREYSYLFWEGVSKTKYDMSSGFVVKASDTEKFLQEKLEYMGLTPREYNEFIVYWVPILKENKYNFIAFQDKAYTESARLDIKPNPDSLLRVFMAYKPLEKPVLIKEQKLKPFERKGFTVVEWGGGEVKK